MTINLDSAAAVVGLLAGLASLAALMFGLLRYVIRAETSELRHNGGSSLKDAVVRTEEKLDRTESKLDEHMTDSRKRVERGAEVEAELRQAIAALAKALPVVAQSAPPRGG